jgi:outer membrane protein
LEVQVHSNTGRYFAEESNSVPGAPTETAAKTTVMRQPFAVLLLLAASVVSAQTAAPAPGNQTLSLADALAIAKDKYPAIKASLEQQAAAQHQIGVAKTAYLPRLDMLWQTNRATDNNRTGLLLPQSVLPSISGPVADDARGRSAWSSAGGVLINWQPFDFGERAAQVNVARNGALAAVSATNLTRLGIAAATASAYLDVVAAQQLVSVAQANVSRMQTFAGSVHVLVDNKLRPGVDASQADAQLALARTQLIQTQTQEKVRLAVLADFLQLPTQQVKVDPATVLSAPPAADPEATSVDAHPAAQQESAFVERQRAQLHVLSRSYVPVFDLLGSISGRGTGLDAQGNFMGGTFGLAPNTLNWAGAVQVSFPAFDIFKIHQEKKVQAANVRAEQMRYQQTMDDVSVQVEQAQAKLDGARQIAQNTPIEVAAAQQSEQQQRARFQSSLATVVEVAVAESILTQAQGDDAIARLNVWRAIADLAVARGNVAPFLKMLGK